MNEQLLTNAFILANTAHANQKRKYTGLPYIIHPVRVCILTARYYPNDVNMQAVALLHDVLEDCKDITPEEIIVKTNATVQWYVKLLTKPSKQPEYSRLNRFERQQIDNDALRNNILVPNPVRIVKMLDIIDNIRDMEDAPADFKKIYLREKEEQAYILEEADHRIGELLRSELKIFRSAL